MGYDEYRQEFYLVNANLGQILNMAKVWLKNHKFKIKKEIPNTYINSYAGGHFAFTDRGTRRWLEIQVEHLPAGNFVSLYEKVVTGGTMVGNIIKEEVLDLTACLKASFPEGNSRIPSISKCPACHTPIKIPNAKFCESCGVMLKLMPTIPSEPRGSFKFCIYCGAQIPTIAIFCEKCGAHLEDKR